MRIFNQDGGEVESCGNATRCVVSLLGHDARIETAGGMIEGAFSESSITLLMPPPRFDWQDIPLAFAMDSAAMPLAWDELASPMAVNVGNPHAIFFVDDVAAIDLADLGPIIEHDAAFPERVNVNVAHIGEGSIDLRVWERGVGETRACGTGACATAVAAIRQGKVASPVTVHQAGGSLTIGWEQGGLIEMTGAATYVFKAKLTGTISGEPDRSDQHGLPPQSGGEQCTGRAIGRSGRCGHRNSCAVTNEAVRQTRQAIRQAHKRRPEARIMVTGCAGAGGTGHISQYAGSCWHLRQCGKAGPDILHQIVRQPDRPVVVSDIMTLQQTAPHLVTAYSGKNARLC